MLCMVLAQACFAQTKNYFIDGFHGGVWGHYPNGYTQFINEQLKANPGWKINLEIEPETWDAVKQREPAAYAEFRELIAAQDDNSRIEYVNPGYGQSYLYTSSGESMIRQLYYGMQTLKRHFPTLRFSSYSSEEPCFTSALPQVLRSFGFQYASLKNPNTCWGGYTRAHGGQLVRWMGPDGTPILMVPRYATEKLLPGSTWQTAAWNNGPDYIQSALNAGITDPVGMCLQDAGWRNGPWLRQHARYVTWREYMGHIADQKHTTDWRVSQEDVQVSLVWGSQVLQQIAQEVRAAENRLVAAEKYAAMRTLLENQPWPAVSIDTAWKTLLLSQHHDCWIVPYNGHKGDTWIDKVKVWTGNTLHETDSILQQPQAVGNSVRIVNTTPLERDEWVTAGHVSFKAKVPAMGFATYTLPAAQPATGKQCTLVANGRYRITTDLYTLTVDPAKGGVITSLTTKAGYQVVDTANARGFNELRGYFYNDNAWYSSMDKPATVTVLEDGGGHTTLQVQGMVGPHPFTQWITLAEGQRRIDLRVKIDWQGNPGIGAYSQEKGFRLDALQKAFYNDSTKLQVLFPANIAQQQVYKDAPYDVTESKLDNTFFSSWDSIKNNVILHWVDVNDQRNGLALLTDHTTSYVHGKDYPLGLTLAYSGRALWGRNYDLTGPTDVRYAIVPHTGNWDNGGMAQEETKWCEPLLVMPAGETKAFSLVSFDNAQWQAPTMMMDGKDLLVRIYNAAGDAKPYAVRLNGKATAAQLEQLDGHVQQALKTKAGAKGSTVVTLAMPRFGIRTLRFKNVIINP